MTDEAPVRRHVNISARSGAQLELRLHWLTRALAVHGGYIVATRRRSTGAGRHVAAVAYELPLPKFARPPRAERRALPRRTNGSSQWSVRQEQGTSSEAV
jgi:hypothetical protein